MLGQSEGLYGRGSVLAISEHSPYKGIERFLRAGLFHENNLSRVLFLCHCHSGHNN